MKFSKKDSGKTLRNLPVPRRLPLTLTEALKTRVPGHAFSDDPLSDKDLSSILWAADGLIGASEKRTTPTLMTHHCVRIYVVKSNGVWLWEPAERALSYINDRDVRREITVNQPLVENAPVHLVYVANPVETRKSVKSYLCDIFKVKPNEADEAIHSLIQTNGPLLDAGAKVEAALLACTALGIHALTRLTFEPKAVSKALKLKPTQVPLCIQTIGYKPRNLFNVAL